MDSVRVFVKVPSLLSISQTRRVLPYFFLLTYIVLLAVTWGGVDFSAARQEGARVFAFALIVWLSYGLIYLLPALILTKVMDWVVHRQRETARRAIVYPLAVLSTGLTTLFFYANAKLFSLYGMFINSFVINLVTTPGGLESMGASNASNLTLAAIALGFLALQGRPAGTDCPGLPQLRKRALDTPPYLHRSADPVRHYHCQ